MPQISVAASAVVAAAPERVYAVLADYRNGHPHILPQPYFSGLVVEQGGYGAGTVLRVTVSVLGASQSYHMTVSEPAPGRLVETDIDSGLTTTFSVAPTARPQECQVTIATTWAQRPGLVGWLESVTTPPIMRMIYRQELQQIQRYLQTG